MTHVIEHPRITEVGRLLARIAALEAENERLRQALREAQEDMNEVGVSPDVIIAALAVKNSPEEEALR